jgi:hypothetical protein
MSLITYPYLRNKEDESITEIENAIKPPYNDLFGPESWRYRVWGAKRLKEMGCLTLNSLKNTDIYAEKEAINQLETELLKIMQKMEALSLQLKVDKAALQFRVENALEAIKIAKSYSNGGVYIG